MLTLLLTVRPSAVLSSTTGYTTDEITTAVGAAWDALDVDDLDCELDYEEDGAILTGGPLFVVSGDVNPRGMAAAEIIHERFSEALTAALAAIV